jgi:dihydrofolate reductase
MRKVILSMSVSMDGFIEGPNKDISWHIWDEEMQAYMNEYLNTADTLLYGRVAYELMLEHWPAAAENPSLTEEDAAFANKMNNIEKVVFSRSLDEVEWNARLVKDNAAEEIKKLKQLPGKNLVLYAGADIAKTFMKHDLIDEYRLFVNPVVLGSGTPLFKEIKGTHHLKLMDTKMFHCGNVLLCYESDRKNNACDAEITMGN